MTLNIGPGFRRALAIGALVPAVGGVAIATGGAASAATMAPAHHQRCDETLTYVQESFFGPRFVFVRDACNIRVIRLGFGRHADEDLFYQTERFGFLQSHFARDVRDVQVF
jgi:hypothetical protein